MEETLTLLYNSITFLCITLGIYIITKIIVKVVKTLTEIELEDKKTTIKQTIKEYEKDKK